MDSRFCSSLIVGCAGALVCGAAEVVVGFRGNEAVNVPEGETCSQTESVWVAPEGVLDKVGLGEWVLPRDLVRSPGALEIGVRSGAVTLSAVATTVPTLAEPTAIMNTAALWMDATRNVVTSNGEDGVAYVTCWKDVRETADTVPFAYVRALPRWSNAWASDYSGVVSNACPQVRTDAQGRNVVYFGRYRSGRWMQFVAPASESAARAITNVCHSFIVYRAVQSWMYPLGSTDTVQFYHPGDSGAGLGGALAPKGISISPTVLSARVFLDGAYIDPTVSFNQVPGQRLLEHDFRGTRASVNNFANGGGYCRPTYASRQGGDDLCEVLVFTNRLSETARLEVERYLMQKWSISPVRGSLSLRVARGATANLDDGARLGNVSGEGTILKRGTDEGVIGPAADTARFTGSLEIAGGSVCVQDEMPVKVDAAGTRITSARTWYGDRLSTTSDAAANQLVKDGEQVARIETIPDGVQKVSVAAGTLVLAAPRTETTIASGTNALAGIEDGSFEGWTSGVFTAAKDSPATNCGWTYGRTAGETADYYTVLDNVMACRTWYIPQIQPDGHSICVFRGKSYAYTAVTVADPGTYELSFATSIRNEGVPAYLEVWFGPDADHLTRGVCASPLSASEYRYQSVLLPDLAAGTYRLEFRSVAPNTQSCPYLDDVQMKIVARPPTADLIPHGDFETLTNVVNSAGAQQEINPRNRAAGWTFAPADSKLVGLGLPGVVNANLNGTSFQRPADLEHGLVQLFLASTGTTATTTFKPRRTGTFQLQADVGAWIQGGNYKYGGIEFINQTPQLFAALKIGEADPVDLGAVSRTGMSLVAQTWPTSFTISDTNATVTLVLSNSVWNAAQLVDNLAFAPVAEARPDLIADGSFEANDTWTLSAPDKNESDANWKYASAVIRTVGNDVQFYGSQRCEGSHFLSLTDSAFATQPVVFSEAGRHELRFFMSQRSDSRVGYGPDLKGRCPIRAWIAREGVTNEIGRLTTSTTNFVAHTWGFNVPDAGEWTFGFEAMNKNPSASNRDHSGYIDKVSIRKMRADDAAATIDLDRALEIEVAANAQLRLEFAGTNEIHRLVLGGHSAMGYITAETEPDYVSGPGALFVRPHATIVILR